jgi:hypothetical protein
MKQFLIVFTFFSFVTSFTILNAQSSDMVSGYHETFVPENIQTLLQQIKQAENNENWESYNQIRQQLIEAWQQVNPEIAKLYRNVNGGTPDATIDGAPVGSKRNNNGESFNNLLEESLSQYNPLWGDDKIVFNGRADDISMDVAINGDIYLMVVGRYDGAATKDSAYIFKSTDGGSNWVEWSRHATINSFEQVEIMAFDGQIGGAGQPSYLLFFYLFDNGWLRVGRTETTAPSWSYYTIAGSSGGGPVTHFAVDRNNSATNYRAICLYDSTTATNPVVKCIRSEPTSYGTVWQDAHSLGFVGRDLDFCYGWNGAVYASYNGAASGNLYARENTNYGDPASWIDHITIVDGAVDTTRHGQIIASREDIPNNIVALVFEKQSGSTYDLYWASRPSGGSWSAMQGWVLPEENKWPALYSRKTTGNQVFRSVFERSGEGNFEPRSIRYKSFDGSIWTESEQVSDAANDVTGLQKPEVADIDGSTAVFAFVGGSYINVYFDNSSWTPSDVNEIPTYLPEEYSLGQNYPNPFNPNTTIKFTIPENSFVSLKVYNVLGKEVATLVSEEMNIGTYEVNFSASDLSSGVYFYKLETGNFAKTNKMILMK